MFEVLNLLLFWLKPNAPRFFASVNLKFEYKESKQTGIHSLLCCLYSSLFCIVVLDLQISKFMYLASGRSLTVSQIAYFGYSVV